MGQEDWPEKVLVAVVVDGHAVHWEIGRKDLAPGLEEEEVRS